MKKIDEKEILRDVLGGFDGESFVAENGDKYPVSPNYASKSCLIKGDELRLLIMSDGQLIYKQINPVERKSLIGIVSETDRGVFVLNEGKMYKILSSSATYMNAQDGDEAVIEIPKYGESEFGALKAIIKKANN